MLTEDKIIQHANFLLGKKTLMPAEYHGWISGATWANGENSEKIEELERTLFDVWAHLRTLVSTVEENRLSEIPFDYLKGKIEMAHEVLKKHNEQ